MILSPIEQYRLLLEFDEILGLGLAKISTQTNPAALQPVQSTSLSPDQQKLLADRHEARAAKNWAVADQLRDQLAAAGITVEDQPNGITDLFRVSGQ